jgi:hypothetical protein
VERLEYGEHLIELGVIKTDVFSFGILLWWFIAQLAILDLLHRID